MNDKLTDRLRGRYSMGPHLPNGEPEFGWRQFQATPINLEAADEIERLERRLQEARAAAFEEAAQALEATAEEWAEFGETPKGGPQATAMSETWQSAANVVRALSTSQGGENASAAG